MALRTKPKGAARVTVCGLLLAAGLVLHYAESMVPVFQVLPGGKLGLANVVTLVAFSWYGTGTALVVGLLRCFLSGLLSGALTMVLYGGTGTLLSVFVMAFVRRVMPRQISTVGRSMLGAFSFNLGQLGVCALVVQSGYVFSYLPVLTLLAAFTGLFTGLLAQRTEAALACI